MWNGPNYPAGAWPAWYEIRLPEWEPQVTENVLPVQKVFAQFADAWKPLDPQVAFVLSIIYSRAVALGIKPIRRLPAAGDVAQLRFRLSPRKRGPGELKTSFPLARE